MRVNSRGQAAVTDTIYFLLIVSGLCVFMFAFSNQYGSEVSEDITSGYYREYTTSALKTILYASISRNPPVTIYDSPPSPDPEVDHLLVLVKEDYADDMALSTETESTLVGNVIDVMEPVGDSFDYLFYIFYMPTAPPGSPPPPAEYAFVFFHKSDFGVSTGAVPPEVEAGRGAAVHKNYVCRDVSTAEIETLVANIGVTYQSAAKVLLLDDTAASVASIGAEADLLMWAATDIPPGAFNHGSGAGGWDCWEPPT